MKLILIILLIIVLFLSVILYREINKINTNDKLNGLDLVMFNPLYESTIIAIIKSNLSPDEFKKRLSTVKKSIIGRRKINKSNSQYILSEDNQDMTLELIEVDMSEEDIDEFINEAYIGDMNKNNIEIIYSSNYYYFRTNHAYYDGWTLSKLAQMLFGNEESNYNITLPKLKYYPLITEYGLIKSYMEINKMEKPQFNNGGKVSRVKNILHIEFVITDKKHDYMSQYIHKIMKLFFQTFPDRKYYNIMILASIDNPKKINNVSFMLFTIYNTDTLETISENIKKRKHQVVSTYVVLNTEIFGGKKDKSMIDICFSSIPLLKNNKGIDNIDIILPYVTYPVYIFNCKIGNTAHTSMHFKDLDIKSLKKTITNNNMIINGERQLL